MSKHPLVYKNSRADVLTPESLSQLGVKLSTRPDAAETTGVEVLNATLSKSTSSSSSVRAPQAVYLYLKHFPATGAPLRVGNHKAVHGLAVGLAANGIKVEVWCEGERDGQTTMPEGYSIRCFATRASHRTLRLAPGLRAHLQELHPNRDLVVLNGMFHPGVYALSRRLKALDIPYVVAPHGPYHPWLFRKNPHLKWPYWYFLERNVLKDSLALQQLDRRHEMWVRRLGIGVPIVATENGFLNNDVIAERELRWRTQGTVRALYWGRMDIHTKGLDVLLTAFNSVARRNPMVLTLQGPDWTGEAVAVKRLVRALDVVDDVVMLPPVFDVPAARVMVSHDMICMPSRFEGFGLAALEAMLAARVLLVSSTTGIAPHIEKSGCGLAVDSNPADLQRGFEQLLSLRDRWREMGMRGRDYALRHLHWNCIAERTLAQYRQLLDRPAANENTARTRS